jgi:hypothetical protein
VRTDVGSIDLVLIALTVALDLAFEHVATQRASHTPGSALRARYDAQYAVLRPLVRSTVLAWALMALITPNQVVAVAATVPIVMTWAATEREAADA